MTDLEKCHLKPSEAAFSTVFFRGSFRPEVVSDVISGANVGQVGMDVPVKFGDRARDIRLPHFVTDRCSRPTDPMTIGQDAA